MVEQNLQTAVRVGFEISEALLARAEETGEHIGVVLDGLVARKNDFLVVVRHAVFREVEIAHVKALVLHLRHLVVDHAADGGVHIAGGHGTHEVKAHVLHGDARRIRADVLHDGGDHRFGQRRAAVADRLADEIFRGIDVLLAERDDGVERGLQQRADGLDLHILIRARLNEIVLIVQADFRLAGGHEGHGVVRVGRELEVDLQALLGEVAALDGDVQERVQRVGIPVEHDVDLAQVVGLGRIFAVVLSAAAAGEHGAEHHGGEQQRADAFEVVFFHCCNSSS